ncbi:hypothetical protein HJFPF1_12962 [Paramyrothecium foliicola]|nr:hypothetical protein HJFPF1_12962 [Paramyrothecium foliicola]
MRPRLVQLELPLTLRQYGKISDFCCDLSRNKVFCPRLSFEEALKLIQNEEHTHKEKLMAVFPKRGE